MTSRPGFARFNTFFGRFACTVNVTGETLVLNKSLPSIKQGFSRHYAGKVSKIVFPNKKQEFIQHKAGQFLFSTRVSPVTFTVWMAPKHWCIEHKVFSLNLQKVTKREGFLTPTQ